MYDMENMGKITEIECKKENMENSVFLDSQQKIS